MAEEKLIASNAETKIVDSLIESPSQEEILQFSTLKSIDIDIE